jgi:tetratricopeptide (TPR) repeat protein
MTLLRALLLLAGLLAALPFPAQSAGKSNPPSSQSVQIGTVNGSAQVTINQTVKQVRQADPKLAEAVLKLSEQLGKKDDEARGLRDENSRLQQQLEIARAGLRLAQEAASPGADADVAAARAAFLKGDTRLAEALFRKREQALVAEGRARLAEAAALARERGALVSGRDTGAAVDAYRQAADYEPDNAENWWNLGDAHIAQGDLTGARNAYQRFHGLAKAKADREPGNSEGQHNLAASHERIGDLLVFQGNLAATLAEYRKAEKVIERLAATDPANSEWQRDLSVSYNKIGDVQVSQGDLPAALAAYRKALEIRERLAARDRAGMNAQWQTDVVVSCFKIGKLAPAAEALPLLRRGLEILRRLDQQGRIDANQASWRGIVEKLIETRRGAL